MALIGVRLPTLLSSKRNIINDVNTMSNGNNCWHDDGINHVNLREVYRKTFFVIQNHKHSKKRKRNTLNNHKKTHWTLNYLAGQGQHSSSARVDGPKLILAGAHKPLKFQHRSTVRSPMLSSSPLSHWKMSSCGAHSIGGWSLIYPHRWWRSWDSPGSTIDHLDSPHSMIPRPAPWKTQTLVPPKGPSITVVVSWCSEKVLTAVQYGDIVIMFQGRTYLKLRCCSSSA